MRNLLINLLFRLLGSGSTKLYNVEYLFGSSTSGHESRKIRWERALARIYKDKDFLDYLFYQSESDKEIAWRGKIDKQISQGARIRTLFIVYSARKAYEHSLKTKRSKPEGRAESDQEINNVEKVYKKLVDIS